MEARHCAGSEMQEMMAYAASVGSARGAAGGREGLSSATPMTAPRIGSAAARGFGTMPHSLIGYAGSTVRAAEMFHETFPDENLTVLVDYFGREITDALACCARFPELAAAGRLSLRLDTHGGRFLEGLDPAESYAVLERNAPGAIRRYRSETELRYLVGTGVSAAAIWRTREALDEAGHPGVRIVVSSGFGVDKCRVMADASAPIDVVGHRQLHPRTMERDLRDGRHRGLRRRADGQGRPRVPAAAQRRAQAAPAEQRMTTAGTPACSPASSSPSCQASGYFGVLGLMAIEFRLHPAALRDHPAVRRLSGLHRAAQSVSWLRRWARSGCNLGSMVAYAVGSLWRPAGGAPLGPLRAADRSGPCARRPLLPSLWRSGGVHRADAAGDPHLYRAAGRDRADAAWRFHLYTFLGSWPWCFLLAWVGMRLGNAWDTGPRLHFVFHYFDYAVAVIALIVIARFVWSRRGTPA